MEAGLLILAAVFFFFILPRIKLYRRGVQIQRDIESKKTASRRSPAPAASTTTQGEIFKWPETGVYDFEIVGESYYQTALKKHAGEHGLDGTDKKCVAFLIPDDNNKYDDKAVRIDIGIDTVGHLSRDDARSFRRRLGAKKLTGQITSCSALIKGGFAKNGAQVGYGIWLDLKEFG